MIELVQAVHRLDQNGGHVVLYAKVEIAVDYYQWTHRCRANTMARSAHPAAAEEANDRPQDGSGPHDEPCSS